MTREEEITRLRQRLAELDAAPQPEQAPASPPVPPPLPEDKSRRIFLSAESWLAWSGVGVLVVGVLLFLRYSLDFITPGMRMDAAAVLCCGLLVWGNLITGRRRLLGSLVFGGGVAGLFSVILASDIHYRFIGHGTAFVLTLAVAAVCLWQAVRRDSQALCLMAVAGAFAAPLFFLGEYQFDSTVAVFSAIVLTCALACYVRNGWWVVLLVSALGAWAFLLIPILVHNASSVMLAPLGFHWNPAPVDVEVLQPAIAWCWLALWLAPVARALAEPVPNTGKTRFRAWVTAFPAGVAGLVSTGFLWKITLQTTWGWMALCIAPVYIIAGLGLRVAAPAKPWVSSVQLATGILFLALSMSLLLSIREAGIVFGVAALVLHGFCRLAKDKSPAVAAHIASLAGAGVIGWLTFCIATGIDGHGQADLFTTLFITAVLLAAPWLNPDGAANPFYRVAGHLALLCLIAAEANASDLPVEITILLAAVLAFASYSGFLSGRHAELRGLAHLIFAILLPPVAIRIFDAPGFSVSLACIAGAMICALFTALASGSRTCRLIYLWALHVLFLALIWSELNNVANGMLTSPVLAAYAVALMLTGVRRKANAVLSAGASVIVILLLRLFFVDLAQIGPAAKTFVFLGIGAFLVAASWFLPRALSKSE